MERVVSAAMFYYDLDSKPHTVDNFERHADILEYLFDNNLSYDRQNYTMGFMTNKKRFVGRYEAYQIAKAASQILPTSDLYNLNDNQGHELYSEDVW